MYDIVVLMSTYNGEKYLKEQLESIIQQKDVHVRILIRDDGSEDSTVNIIEEYHKKYSDNIFILRGENMGFARSFSILLSEGRKKFKDIEYFAFADQDDVWMSDKLISGIEAIEIESNDIPVTYCSATRQVDMKLKPLGQDTILPKEKLSKPRALVQNFATGCTMVFNRKALEMYVFNQPEDIKVHDFLMFQICMFFGKVIYDPVPHILYRQHNENQIGRPNALVRMKRRFMGNFLKHVMEIQNRNFYHAYSSFFNEEDRMLLETFINYRSSFFKRLKLLFSRKISCIGLEKNFFYRLKIILGTV